MKLKNKIFMNGFIGALQNLVNEKMPAPQAFRLRQLAQEVDAQATVFNDSRLALCERYAKKDEEGKPVLTDGNFDIEDMEGFNKELQELVDLECEYKAERLKLPADIQISANDIAILEDIIDGADL